MTVRARWTAWCNAYGCGAQIGMEKSISDAHWIATEAGWLVKDGRTFCPQHHPEAVVALGARRPSPKLDLLVALVAQQPGLGARALAEILAGGRVSAVRVNQVASMLRAARLRGLVVKESKGWHLVGPAVERSESAVERGELVGG